MLWERFHNYACSIENIPLCWLKSQLPFSSRVHFSQWVKLLKPKVPQQIVASLLRSWWIDVFFHFHFAGLPGDGWGGSLLFTPSTCRIKRHTVKKREKEDGRIPSSRTWQKLSAVRPFIGPPRCSNSNRHLQHDNWDLSSSALIRDTQRFKM